MIEMPGKYIILLLASLLFPIIPAAAEQPRPVVAIIVPLSGQLAFMGDGLRKGMLLNEELHASYDLIFEDNKGSEAEAVSAYRKI